MGEALLKLTIEESGDRCRIVAEFDSTEREINVPMLPETFRESLRPLQEAILQSPAARSEQLPARPARETTTAVPADSFRPTLRDAPGPLSTGADERMVQEIGSQLFDFVFNGRILELYQDRFAAAQGNERPLSIRLHVKHPALSYVPWETLYDRTNRFYLTTSQNTPFMRTVRDDEDERALNVGRPIRILGMAARPKILNGIALDLIEVDAEQVAIKKALGGLGEKRVKLSWTPSAQARDLNRRFLKGDDGNRWDIFHFIGHGGHDAQKKMGFIVVQEEGGSRGSKLYADDLRSFLTQPGRTPSLVILNSCSGAQAEPGVLFSSTAAELIQGGVPAVIAMQFEISDNMGVAFSDTFYTYLADNVSIQKALAHTRAELKARHFGEWISPVLYMRGVNGELFKDTTAMLASAIR